MGGLFVNRADGRAESAGRRESYPQGMDNVAAVLAELEEERRRLWMELARVERVISVIEELARPEPRIAIAAAEPIAVLALPAVPEPPPPPPPPPPPKPQPYAALDVYEATAIYLAEAGEPKNAREIADALVAGGFRTRSRYFTNIIGTMLRRRESTRPHRISVTADGKHWFVRPKRKSTKTQPPALTLV
jgi:hypothetical protein